jgi:uncharacterized Zn finger protein (UPF0148 family)
MSDFDKEAERQRLREKYEEDQEDREATQRMSELLLQGATMTNRHCDTCGDPIFRYEGQEFCPTCQSAAIEAAGEDTAVEEHDADEAAPTAGEDEGAGSDVDERPQREDETGRQVTPTGRDPADDAGEPAASDVRETASSLTTDARSTSTSASSGAREVAPAQERSAADAAPGAAASGAAGDLSEARASLVRTLTRLARAAESTDDPRRTREYLSAAREAAEAVAALDRR